MKNPNLLLILFCIFSFEFIPVINSNAQMSWNQTAQFAGSASSYIAAPNTTDLNLTGSFTLEAWINPTTVSTTDKGIISKGSTLGASLRYALRIIPGGRLTVSTNGIVRLTSTGTVSVGNWKHVCATFDAVTDSFKIYIDGVLNVRNMVVGADPASNTDSLFIGVSGNTALYSGQMDDVRIWNRALSAVEIGLYFRTSLGISSGPYIGLILSYPFQKNNSGGTLFSLNDWSGNNNNGYNRGLTSVDQSNRPSVTTFQNESIELNGSSDYLLAGNSSLLSPTSAITLEAWIHPRTITGTHVIIGKNSSTSYRLNLNSARKVEFIPKGGVSMITSKNIISTNRWTHVAASYNGSSTNIYINGVLDTSFTSITGAIGTNTDSLHIGADLSGGLPTGFFNGFIDEVRIANYMKTADQINAFILRSIDSLNQPNAASNNVCYNLDGSGYDNGDGAPKLVTRGNAKFSHPATVNNQPVSPLNRLDTKSFIEGFTMRKTDKRLPASGGTGTVDDTIDIPFNVTISDINLFVAINHRDESNLDLFLIAPNGESIDFSTDNTLVGANDNVITIFDDQADTSVLSLRHISFSPAIRPEKNFSTIFSGDNSQGIWRLRITDDGGTADTGRLYGWGIQFNNSTSTSNLTTLDLTSTIEGLWSVSTMVQDTVRVYLRNSGSPYNITDSGKIFLNTSGNGLISFANTGTSSKYIVVKHRNSIETWSAAPQSFTTGGTTVYNFTTAANKAYGNNLVLKDGKYCIYSGDPNQDGVVDATDVSSIDNDAANFLVGYVKTDLNGDNFVDGSDFSLGDNNAANFISTARP